MLISFPPTVGITPAWAGKREAIERLKAERKDHPRVGGEKVDASNG